MATESQILESLAMTGAQFSFEIPDSTVSIWTQIFRKVDGEDLKAACIHYLATTKIRRVPLPGELFQIITAGKKRANARDLSNYECRDCGQLGLVRKKRLHNKRMIDFYTPCECALGQSKLAYLQKRTD